MIRVLTTSMGVVMTAATEPAELADIAVTVAVSHIDPVAVPCLDRYAWMDVRRRSNMGNCMAVNGRLRPASAV